MSFQIKLQGTDISFVCQPGQTILDAALKSGISLPYSCRKGICGNCAGSVTEGNIQPHGSLPFRHDNCAEGQVLFCGCEPSTDLVIQPTSWKRSEDGAPKTFTARVYRNELAAPDVSVLQLRLPAGKKIKFRAGQYLLIRMEDGSSRSYSMANAPHESDGVTLHIRHVPGGYFSSRVSTLKPGDTLDIELPYGHVDLDEQDNRPVVFVAGGTGFAPVKSILDGLLKKKAQRQLALIWGARDPSGLYMQSAVEKWQKFWPDFQFVPAVNTVPTTSDGNSYFVGRADEALACRFNDLNNHIIYICGSPGMVEAVRQTALSCGASPKDIHTDSFVEGPASQ